MVGTEAQSARSLLHWPLAAPSLSIISTTSTIADCNAAHCRSLRSSPPWSALLQAVLLTSEARGSKTVRLSDMSGRLTRAPSNAAGLATMFETSAPCWTKIILHLHSAPMRPRATGNVAVPLRGAFSSRTVVVQGAAIVAGGRALAKRHLTASCTVLVATMPRQPDAIVAPHAAHRAPPAARSVAGQAPAVGVAAPTRGAVDVWGQFHAAGFPLASVHLATPPEFRTARPVVRNAGRQNGV